MRAPVWKWRRRRVSGSDQADASRGERHRGEGWVRGKGAMRLIGGDGVRISRKGIVRARGVCGMECAEVAPRRLRRGHSACGAETPRTELREQGYVCGGMPGQGRRAGLRAAQEPWVGPPGALASGQRDV